MGLAKLKVVLTVGLCFSKQREAAVQQGLFRDLSESAAVGITWMLLEGVRSGALGEVVCSAQLLTREIQTGYFLLQSHLWVFVRRVCVLAEDVTQHWRVDVLGMGQKRMMKKETRRFLPSPPAPMLLKISK